MLRRLLLGQPRRCEIKDAKKEICEEEKRIPDPLLEKSTENDLEGEHEAKDDIYDSDSETDGSETEDSDTETLDNSSRTDSYEDCSADVLEWKGFEVVRDARLHGSSISPSKMIIEMKGNPQGQNGEVKQRQQNPFENAFDIQGNEMPHDEIKSEGNNSNNNNSSKKSNTAYNKNDDQNNNDEYDNKSDSTSSQANNKQTHQPNDNKTATATKTDTNSIASTNDRKTNDATESTTKSKNNNRKEINNSTQKIDTARQLTRFDQPKMRLELAKPSTTNQKPPNSKAKGISRNYSIRENKNTSTTKRQTSSRINTEGKPLPSTRIPGKDPKVCRAQNSVMGHQGIGKDRMGFRGTRLGDKQKQGNVNLSHISVSDLESVLGVNVTELRDVIRKYKSEKASTADDSQGQRQVAQGNLDTPGMEQDSLIDGKKSQGGCKKGNKNEIIDNKDEISSDSGVSEPDAHNTDSQPHYITLKAIIKRKKHFEGQIKKLEGRIVEMGDHEKDIQFVHDLFDLHNDGLDKVERSNGGLACLANLKSILACQLREIDEEEFRAKLKGLEDLGIPNFSEINARIEKLRKRICHALDDERKCRSKGVQKLRFEIGKVQGMCVAVLDLVYTE